MKKLLMGLGLFASLGFAGCQDGLNGTEQGALRHDDAKTATVKMEKAEDSTKRSVTNQESGRPGDANDRRRDVSPPPANDNAVPNTPR